MEASLAIRACSRQGSSALFLFLDGFFGSVLLQLAFPFSLGIVPGVLFGFPRLFWPFLFSHLVLLSLFLRTNHDVCVVVSLPGVLKLAYPLGRCAEQISFGQHTQSARIQALS